MTEFTQTCSPTAARRTHTSIRWKRGVESDTDDWRADVIHTQVRKSVTVANERYAERNKINRE